ncbi:MAG: HAMP domain-containing sensor histidine kinase [Acholeplasmataceae bacterium]|nr:HAMP domain-containing sensor histidine kinase [Acholeplasmataceae bacterium]
MTNFNQLFKQKMTRFITIFFASLLLIANLGLFVSSSIQYNREIDRQTTSFIEMMEHLITIEDIETSIIYLEHYDHTHGVNLIYYDSFGNILYQSDIISKNPKIIDILDSNDVLLGSISIDYQSSVLGYEFAIGLIAFNLFSVVLFICGLIIMNKYLNQQYLSVKEDMNQIGQENIDFRFKDIESINIQYMKALSTEKEVKDLQAHYVKVLAHDVKTPLTVMKAYLEGVASKRISFNEEMNKDLLNEIVNIEKIIPQLMISNIEDIVKKQNIAIQIRSHILKLTDTFKSKEITIDSNIEDLEIEASIADIIRIVDHLMINAFYYSEKRTVIKIELSSKEKMLSVSDQGIGMSLDTLNRITKENYRSEEAKALHKTGSGIGLQIVKSIVEKMNASITIDSEQGVGTRVKIYFK